MEAGHARQRAVLAVLLFDLGRVVPVTRLIDRVWGDEPPASGRNVLYGYVANLRAVITRTGDPDVTLTRQSGGYRLDADQAQVDLHRFRRLLSEAAAATGDDRRAGVLLTGALELWRGTALAGLDSPWLNGMREALELQRRTAVLDLGDITLRKGSHRTLAASLAEEAVHYPADERLIGQLMLALYRCGQQAEALQWFEQTRRRLADEYGADPGPQLQALHLQILRADPLLTVAEPASNGRARPVPRQLPAALLASSGRTAELPEPGKPLTPATAHPAPGTSHPAETTASQAQASAAVICMITSKAGTSKAALTWAHEVKNQFPDGQFYVNLRGHGHGQPMTAAEALAVFLRALGMPGPDIAAETEERAVQYRNSLTGRRMLVVLDEASSAEQVQPLLPGTSACLTLVTSRNPLAGLAVGNGAMHLDLDTLPADDAVTLLRALARQCRQQPLAPSTAEDGASTRCAVPQADLVGRPGLSPDSIPPSSGQSLPPAGIATARKRILRATGGHLNSARTDLVRHSCPATERGSRHRPARHAEGKSGSYRTPRYPWSGHASGLLWLPCATLVVVSLIFAAVFWRGFTTESSNSIGHFPQTRTSPNGTILTDDVNPMTAACGRDTVTLVSAPVSASVFTRAVAGRLQLLYSPACHSTWARYAPWPPSHMSSTPILLWQKRLSDEMPEIRHGWMLKMAYTGMLMADHGCVEVGITAMPQKNLWPATTFTVCATEGVGPNAGRRGRSDQR